MDTQTKFSKKVEELSRLVSEAQNKAKAKESCFPMMLIAGIAAPIVVWVVLYFLQPSFVQKKEGDKYIRDNKRVLLWTVIVTVVIWIAMYLFTYCQGYDPLAMFCVRT